MSTSASSRRRRGPHDGADALRGAAAAADHAAEVAGADPDVEAHPAPALGGLDRDGVGIVDDRRDDVGEHGDGGRAPSLGRPAASSASSTSSSLTSTALAALELLERAGDLEQLAHPLGRLGALRAATSRPCRCRR